MPLYEYRCEDCSSHFELRQSFSDSSIAPCPRCRGQARRCFSPATIIFKGPGFYITDSRQSQPKADSEESS